MTNPPPGSNDEMNQSILDASKPPSAAGSTPPPKKSGTGLVMAGLVLTGVGLFALNEGFGLIPSDRTYLDTEAILHGSLLGGVGLLLLGGGLSHLTGKRLLLLPLLTVGSLVGFAWTQRGTIVSEHRETQDEQRELLEDFVEVCADGEGIEDAARFEHGGTEHPTLAYFGRGSTEDLEWGATGYDTPEDWAVENGDDVELVACIEVENQPIHSCSYGTVGDESILFLIRYVQTLKLRAARTGEVLFTEEFPGGDPPPCPNTHDFATGNRLYGSLVSRDEIYTRIGEFMEDGLDETEESENIDQRIKPSGGNGTAPGKPRP